jgi:acetyl/propionyl-CoA carboxylase alpha subunit
MTFEIECNGRRRLVSLEAEGSSRFRVTVDAATMTVDVARVGRHGLSVLDVATGRSRLVALTAGDGAGDRLAWIDGLTVAVNVDGRHRRGRGSEAGGSDTGEQAIAAPMPGRVVRVLVAVGDEVAARQPCIVVEAMKMENELRAPRAGRIRSVSVEPGMPVEAGRVLVVIE